MRSEQNDYGPPVTPRGARFPRRSTGAAFAVALAVGLHCARAAAQPLACVSATVCATDMECGEHTRCVPGAFAVCDDAGVCAATSGCVVSWQAPCHSDDQCGDGFRCSMGPPVCVCSHGTADASADDASGGSSEGNGSIDTPCTEVPPVVVCAEGGGECVETPACDGGICSCQAQGECTVAPLPCSGDPSSCPDAAACVGGICAPSGWTCDGGACTPPCFAETADADVKGISPSGDTAVAADYPPGPPSNCQCNQVGRRGGDSGWLVAIGLIALARQKKRG